MVVGVAGLWTASTIAGPQVAVRRHHRRRAELAEHVAGCCNSVRPQLDADRIPDEKSMEFQAFARHGPARACVTVTRRLGRIRRSACVSLSHGLASDACKSPSQRAQPSHVRLRLVPFTGALAATGTCRGCVRHPLEKFFWDPRAAAFTTAMNNRRPGCPCRSRFADRSGCRCRRS